MKLSAVRKRIRRLERLLPVWEATLRDAYPTLPPGGEPIVAAAAINAALAVWDRTADQQTMERSTQLVADRTAANVVAGIQPAAPRFPVGIDGQGDAGALDQLLVELGWDLSRPRNPDAAPKRIRAARKPTNRRSRP